MTVWDCFMFRGSTVELDLLEMRFTEFQDVPDLTHVLVEAEVDFQGHHKPLWFEGHKERFAPWKDRVVHVIAANLPDSPDPWQRERAQRNWCAEGCKDAGPDDMVLISDVDEIPELPLPPLGDSLGWAQLTRHMTFAVDWENPVRQICTTAVRWKQIRSFARTRDLKYWIPRRGGGWHFSWLGGPEAISGKNASMAHLEHKAKVAEGNAAGLLYQRGFCPWMGDDGMQMKPVDVDETWPAWIAHRKCPDVWFRPRELEAV